MLVGAAALLHADPPPGPVRLLWQPAEERGNGALVRSFGQMMVDEHSKSNAELASLIAKAKLSTAIEVFGALIEDPFQHESHCDAAGGHR
jgi:metal-dependent amidase/aminoacylase/carboxypeptidase family protein